MFSEMATVVSKQMNIYITKTARDEPSVFLRARQSDKRHTVCGYPRLQGS